MPQEEAIGYMEDAATKSYLKKGQDVVDMNHKAIDAGATAFVKIDEMCIRDRRRRCVIASSSSGEGAW